MLNRLLLDRLKTPTCLYAILYSNSGQEPRQDGILWKWMVDRSDAIGALFARIKNGQMLFPSAKEVGSFLDEFECETAEYDDANRTVKFTHPATLQDDALHATNYALLVGIRLHYAAKSGGYY